MPISTVMSVRIRLFERQELRRGKRRACTGSGAQRRAEQEGAWRAESRSLDHVHVELRRAAAERTVADPRELRGRKCPYPALYAPEPFRGQHRAGLFSQVLVDDTRGRMREAVYLDKIQAWLVDPVPSGQRLLPLAGEKTTGCEQLPAEPVQGVEPHGLLDPAEADTRIADSIKDGYE